jgi:predicted phosphate transport protein (TIGR00153 family)
VATPPSPEVYRAHQTRPTEDAFYAFFSQAAVNLVKGAEILSELSQPSPEHQSISDRLIEIEHANDDVTHEMLRKLNSTFITPFDREDIYRLGSTLDDVMDHMEAVGNLIYLYGLSKLPSLPREMHELVIVIGKCAAITAEAMPRLKTLKQLEEYWIEVNRLENEGDRAYRMLLVRLFSGEYDALTVLKLKEVADELEAAIDAFEHVANTVETIAVKESTSPTDSMTPPTRSRHPSPPAR